MSIQSRFTPDMRTLAVGDKHYEFRRVAGTNVMCVIIIQNAVILDVFEADVKKSNALQKMLDAHFPPKSEFRRTYLYVMRSFRNGEF